MVSDDGGKTFTREGLRIPDQFFDPSADLWQAAHGRIIKLKERGYVAILSTSTRTGGHMNNGVSLLTSDDGLKFSFSKVLYPEAHDPFVIQMGDMYRLYAIETSLGQPQVKHESGFCLWDSPGYGYSVAQSSFKGDIIGGFVAACNAEGILPGVHYSIPDGYNESGVRARGPVSPAYFALIKKHLTELHTRYPGIRIQKIDSVERLSPEQYAEIRDLVKRLNPNCVLLNNSKLPERGLGCNDDSIIKSWMWKPQAQLNPANVLFDHYSIAREAGRAYALNVGPDTTGHIPDNQMAILMQLKDMIATRPLTPPPAPAQPAAAQPSAADRLKQLKSLYDQGLINKEDYDRKSKEILDSL
jgi:hypothetical protein